MPKTAMTITWSLKVGPLPTSSAAFTESTTISLMEAMMPTSRNGSASPPRHRPQREQALRESACFLARRHPDVRAAADVGRCHVEAFKRGSPSDPPTTVAGCTATPCGAG